ncbi:DUF4198 domain-containing protein, partial [Candidatus Poribacteria bacterium]|nr:DUF4198 domain-containing protein [Candidatus Poribacteria bacterium]
MNAMMPILTLLLGSFILTSPAYAHFQMIVPSTEIVSPTDGKEISLKLLFAHPMEGHAMDMAKPAAFGVIAAGEKQNLLET